MVDFILYVLYIVLLAFVFSLMYYKMEEKGIGLVKEGTIPNYFYLDIKGLQLVPLIIGYVVVFTLEMMQVGTSWVRLTILMFILTTGNHLLTDKNKKVTGDKGVE